MKCPKCGYVMQPFDSECDRCHGNGIAQNVQQTPQPASKSTLQQLRSINDVDTSKYWWVYLLFIFIILPVIGFSDYNPLSLIMSRRDSSSEPVSQSADSSSSSGLVSAAARINVGTTLYNSDGSVFGTVTDISRKHPFPKGEDEGVEVDGFWYLRSFIKSSKYVRE